MVDRNIVYGVGNSVKQNVPSSEDSASSDEYSDS